MLTGVGGIGGQAQIDVNHGFLESLGRNVVPPGTVRRLLVASGTTSASAAVQMGLTDQVSGLGYGFGVAVLGEGKWFRAALMVATLEMLTTSTHNSGPFIFDDGAGGQPFQLQVSSAAPLVVPLNGGYQLGPGNGGRAARVQFGICLGASAANVWIAGWEE